MDVASAMHSQLHCRREALRQQEVTVKAKLQSPLPWKVHGLLDSTEAAKALAVQSQTMAVAVKPLVAPDPSPMNIHQREHQR